MLPEGSAGRLPTEGIPGHEALEQHRHEGAAGAQRQQSHRPGAVQVPVRRQLGQRSAGGYADDVQRLRPEECAQSKGTPVNVDCGGTILSSAI